jgi:hypothetical protein
MPAGLDLHDLESVAKANLGRAAVVMAHGARRAYAELLDRSNRLARLEREP